MSMGTVIISAVSLVAIFWILYAYSVRRARFLVALESEILSVNLAEEKQTIDVVDNYQTKDTIEQPRDINEVPRDEKTASEIKSHQINQNVQIKPSLAAGVGR
jgi:hypothetical protein